MTSRPNAAKDVKPEGSPGIGADKPMTAEQAALLKQLSHDAYDVDAFSRRLTQNQAAERIAILQAKLTLMSEPPHTQ